uniref:Uncharacterized protein n=1 Tax=Oncorhynchus kisutch TaxID=8019 RepID=A0A8C7I8X3_ONCKI
MCAEIRAILAVPEYRFLEVSTDVTEDSMCFLHSGDPNGRTETVSPCSYKRMADRRHHSQMHEHSRPESPTASQRYPRKENVHGYGLYSIFSVVETGTENPEPFNYTCETNQEGYLADSKLEENYSSTKQLSEKEIVLKTDGSTDNSDSEVKGDTRLENCIGNWIIAKSGRKKRCPCTKHLTLELEKYRVRALTSAYDYTLFEEKLHKNYT